MNKIKFLFLGFVFGIILVKAEVVSWFRIQEMFRFQSFQMYGIIGSAILVGMISIAAIKRYQVKSISGEPIVIADKKLTKGNVLGGLIFGFGWAMTGACPGPLYALVGSGIVVVVVVLLSAVLGTYIYGVLNEKLPH
jgi:uncharacterized membrane protein YedE/YeeE